MLEMVELVEVGSEQLSWWGGARWIRERALRGAGSRVSGDELYGTRLGMWIGRLGEEVLHSNGTLQDRCGDEGVVCAEKSWSLLCRYI
jgi:hypothetical protein